MRLIPLGLVAVLLLSACDGASARTDAAMPTSSPNPESSLPSTTATSTPAPEDDPEPSTPEMAGTDDTGGCDQLAQQLYEAFVALARATETEIYTSSEAVTADEQLQEADFSVCEEVPHPDPVTVASSDAAIEVGLAGETFQRYESEIFFHRYGVYPEGPQDVILASAVFASDGSTSMAPCARPDVAGRSISLRVAVTNEGSVSAQFTATVDFYVSETTYLGSGSSVTPMIEPGETVEAFVDIDFGETYLMPSENWCEVSVY